MFSNIVDTFTTIIMGGKLFGNETVLNCFVHVSVLNEYSRLTPFGGGGQTAQVLRNRKRDNPMTRMAIAR